MKLLLQLYRLICTLFQIYIFHELDKINLHLKAIDNTYLFNFFIPKYQNFT